MNRVTHAPAPPVAWTTPPPAAVLQNANAATAPPVPPRPPAPGGPPPALTYCWTHGSSINIKHTSSTCKNKAEGHQDNATTENKMGGSEKIWTGPRIPRG